MDHAVLFCAPSLLQRVFGREKENSMARYTGPKGRINRRLGTLIYETAGASRALDRRPNPPGMHVRGRRPSNYGAALMEKQKNQALLRTG
jgi:hypothetical protein